MVHLRVSSVCVCGPANIRFSFPFPWQRNAAENCIIICTTRRPLRCCNCWARLILFPRIIFLTTGHSFQRAISSPHNFATSYIIIFLNSFYPFSFPPARLCTSVRAKRLLVFRRHLFKCLVALRLFLPFVLFIHQKWNFCNRAKYRSSTRPSAN